MSNLSRSAFASALLLSAAFPAFAEEPVEEIIVTASPLGRSLDEAITGVSVLTGEELDDRLAGTIGETLKSEPGVSSTFFGAGASRPIIRGQGGDRVRVLTNGIGSIDASSASPDHAVAAEPAQAERIEVLRGASLLRYGSSGSGGIVNIIDGRIPDALPDGKYDGAFRIGASSVDAGIEAAGALDTVLFDAPTGSLVLHVDGTYKKTDDYDIPGFAESAAFRAAEAAEEEEHHDDEDEDEHEDEEHGHDEEGEEEAFGTLENSATETRSLTGGLSWVGNRGFIGVAVHDFESDYGIPGGHGHGHEEEGHDDDHDEDEDEEHHDEDEDEHGHEEGEEEEETVTIGLEQTRIDLNAGVELDGAFSRLTVFAGYADYKHTEFEGDEVGTVFANEGYEVRTELLTAKRGDYSAAYGAQIRKREFSAIGEEAFVPPSVTDQFGIYTFQETQFGDLHVEGAARVEKTDHENKTAGISRDFTGISVSAGGDYHFSDALRIGGTVFRTERAPTTEELFSNGPHLATSQFEIGDPDLDIETATGVEAAIRYRSGPVKLTANVFYTDYDDYIFETQTGEEEDELDVYQYGADDARFSGFELQGELHAGTFGQVDLDFDGLVEYVSAKTDRGNLPRIPPLSVLAGVDAGLGDFSYRAEVEFVSEADDIAAFETATDSYTLTNLFATWRPSGGEADYSLKLAVNNLFDEDARQHTSFLKDTVPLPGRNIKVSAVSRF